MTNEQRFQNIRHKCQQILDNTEHLANEELSTLAGDTWKLAVVRYTCQDIIEIIDYRKDETE